MLAESSAPIASSIVVLQLSPGPTITFSPGEGRHSSFSMPRKRSILRSRIEGIGPMHVSTFGCITHDYPPRTTASIPIQTKNLIPALPRPHIIAPLRPLKGAFARRSLRRDGARRPRVWSRGSGTRAAPGLRSGPLRVPARSWLKWFEFPRSTRPRPIAQLKNCATATYASAASNTENAARRRNENAACGAPMRRPPCPATDADTTGLRFSARRFPSGERTWL